MSTYVAIAYRWGWTNNHHYIVAASDNLEDVKAYASRECRERGGKYGVIVYDVDAEDNHRTAYYPSSYGEKEPHINSRIALAESLGFAALSAIEDGYCLVNCEFLYNVEVPDWLRAKYEYELEMGRVIEVATKTTKEKEDDSVR